MNRGDRNVVLVTEMGTMELAVVGLAGSGLGTVLGVPMVWPGQHRPVDVRLMGGWLIAVSALVAVISARLLGLLPATPGVNHAINLLGLSAYPLLFLYVHEHTRGAFRPGRSMWLWTPAAVYLVAFIVRFGVGANTRVPFAWMLPVLVGFTLACVLLVRTRTEARRDGVVPVAWIVAFLVVLNIAQAVRMLFGHLPIVPAVVPLVVTGGFVAVVAQVVWKTLERRTVRYEKSGLDKQAGMAMVARVEQALSKDRLFADQNLTLGTLAAAVDATPHQVSEVLNRYAQVTFHELLNRRRVADVKAQLAEPAAQGYTIEGIGASSGFGSRSALYAAFRRLEGMTPAEFRATAQRRDV